MKIPLIKTSGKQVTRPDYRSVFMIVLFGAVLTAVAIIFQKNYAAEQFNSKLALRAKDEAALIQQHINNVVEIMESIRNFYAASVYVDRDEFKLFLQSQINLHSEIRALQWVPLIKDRDRAAIESELAKVISERAIFEQDAQNQAMVAGERQEYFPVFYIEPLEGNQSILGYDLHSNPNLRIPIALAIQTRSIVFSDKVQLTLSADQFNGIFVFQPVYDSITQTGSIMAPDKELLGLAVGLLDPSKVIENSTRNFNPTGLDVLLVNEKQAGRPEILYFHSSRTRDVAIAQPDYSEYLAAEPYAVTIDIPGGRWGLYFRPAPAFYEESRSIQTWVILIIGIVLTALLAFNVAKRIRHTEEILYQAQHDALTGLPNRTLFQHKLRQELTRTGQDGMNFAVLFLDLDNFKHINDSLGHAVGDELLIEVARRLRENTRSEDIVARMGGDEFILLVKNANDQNEIARLAQKMLLDITSPYVIGERTFYLSASIGISRFPQDAMTAGALIANADAAMYRAKSRGRNIFDFYSADLTTSSMKRLQLEVELREAIKNESLSVYYQPQVSLVSGEIIGAEALARWIHPEYGNIPPDQFIPVAEDSGLMVEIGEWILRRACRQAKIWLDAGIPLRTMAVNVSGVQIQRTDFVYTVQQVLKYTGLPARHLELELTESVIMAQADQAIETLLALGRLGVTLAIDDFGTGHSSLAYLKRLPLDKLKIDRSFVMDLPDNDDSVAITNAIIALSNSLHLRVIAEGVETRAQKDFLRQLGCDEAQGYYFSRPVPVEKFGELFHKAMPSAEGYGA